MSSSQELLIDGPVVSSLSLGSCIGSGVSSRLSVMLQNPEVSLLLLSGVTVIAGFEAVGGYVSVDGRVCFGRLRLSFLSFFTLVGDSSHLSSMNVLSCDVLSIVCCFFLCRTNDNKATAVLLLVRK